MFLDSTDPGIERRPRRRHYNPERALAAHPQSVTIRAIEIWNTQIRPGVYPSFNQSVQQAIEEVQS